MNEDQVIALMKTRWGVPRETLAKLQRFASLLIQENKRQNLIARSTEDALWDRHILDSAQLLDFADQSGACWLDVGTGAGFPGLVLAILSPTQHILVEPRRRRAAFLSEATVALGLENHVRVVQQDVERMSHPAAINAITARAVSSVGSLINSTRHLADESSIWLLHKGRTAAAEVDAARRVLCAKFEMFPSMTDPDAAIVRISNLQDVCA